MVTSVERADIGCATPAARRGKVKVRFFAASSGARIAYAVLGAGVTVAFGSSDEVPGNLVARILVDEVGSSYDDARKEAR